jgi:hypothetical protein
MDVDRMKWQKSGRKKVIGEGIIKGIDGCWHLKYSSFPSTHNISYSHFFLPFTMTFF